MSEQVELFSYDPDWPAAFVRERDRILPLFPGPPLLIEHMGSTAVPGIVAKPIIDIIVLVEPGTVRAAVPALEASGYTYRADASNERHSFLRRHRPADQRRTHHLHIHDDPDEVRRHLVFRDRLRAKPAVRDAYVALKRDLADRYRDDRLAYSKAKTAFVDAIVAAANGPARRDDWNL